MRVVLPLLLSTIIGCSESNRSRSDDMIADLNKRVIGLTNYIDDPDSSRKALSVLNQITALDSNNFLGHYNKLMFYNRLNESDSAIITLNKLIQLKPRAHDLYLSVGLNYSKLGDTLLSQIYLNKSLEICENVLDTMKNTNPEYRMLITNKAIAIILGKDSLSRQTELDDMYKKENNDEIKNELRSLMSQSREQLIRDYSN